MKRVFALLLALLTVLGCAASVSAKGKDPKGYLVLGEDLKGEEKAKVLDFLQVKDLDDYVVSYTSNRQEHKAFDDYLGAEVVGTRALSSILLTPRKKGEGIQVSSYNITYCTVEMYQNALISAGVKDVSVSIAAPMPVSGTCALVSAMNAYSLLSGEEIDPEAADVAAEELVTTGEVGDLIGDRDTAAELIAAVKQKMIEEDLNEEELSLVIDQAGDKLGVTLDAERKQQVIELLMRLKNTDIDVDELAKQAGDLYHKVSGILPEMDIQPQEAAGLLQKIFRWVMSIFGAVS